MLHDEELELPQNVDAEASILAAIMLDNRCLYQAVERLKTPSAFYRTAHRRTYEAMLAIDSRSEPIDLVTVASELKARGTLDECGGSTGIAALLDTMPRVENIATYAAKVADAHTLRKCVNFAYSIKGRATAPGAIATEVVGDLARLGGEISTSSIRGGLTPFADIAHAHVEWLEELGGPNGKPHGIPTGFSHLDNLTGGLQRPDMILIAARPSLGKTSLSLNVVEAALDSGKAVGYFSAEMSAKQLTNRLLAARYSIDSASFLHGRFTHHDWKLMSEGLAWAEGLGPRFSIDDASAPSTAEIKAKCLRMKAEVGLDLIVVDYLQLLTPGKRTSSREQEVSSISRGLKSIAKDLDVPLIALSQLTRANAHEKRAPELFDLRDSGTLEQDADLVLFLHAPDPTMPFYVELLLKKQRNGPLGKVPVKWNGEHVRFESWYGPKPGDEVPVSTVTNYANHD